MRCPIVFTKSILLVLFLGLVPITSLLAADESITTEAQQPFVDLDGDGFDDSMEDNNGDGIPEPISASPQATAPAAINDNMFGSVQLVRSSMPAFLHNSGTFNHLKRQLTALVQHRGGFSIGAEFGPGSDIGSGAVLGGACAGGACGPN